MVKWLAAWTLFSLLGCAASTAKTSSASRTYLDSDAGVLFELPTGWIETHEGAARVFSGPMGHDTYYTTIALQAVAGAPLKLDLALEQAFEPLATLPQFGWDARDVTVADGYPSLRYTVQFELHETLRRKTGLLLVKPPYVIDLSYAATDDLFAQGIPVFENLLDSLTLAPRHELASRVPDHL